MNAFVRAIALGAVNSIVESLDVLAQQIREGRTEEALQSVNALKDTVIALRNRFLS